MYYNLTETIAALPSLFPYVQKHYTILHIVREIGAHQIQGPAVSHHPRNSDAAVDI